MIIAIGGNMAAITRNTYGRGSASYVGCIPSDAFMLKLVKKVAEQAGLFEAHERLEFPLITRKGTNDADAEFILLQLL